MNTDGSTGVWSTANALRTVNFAGTPPPAVANGNIYATVVCTTNTLSGNQIFYAKLRATAPIGTWYCQGTAANVVAAVEPRM